MSTASLVGRRREGGKQGRGGQEAAPIPLPAKLQCCGGGEVKRRDTSESLQVDAEISPGRQFLQRPEACACCQVGSLPSAAAVG